MLAHFPNVETLKALPRWLARQASDLGFRGTALREDARDQTLQVHIRCWHTDRTPRRLPRRVRPQPGRPLPRENHPHESHLLALPPQLPPSGAPAQSVRLRQLVPEHPVLGTELLLPCLLRLPSLRLLHIAKTIVWNEWDEVGITLPAGSWQSMKIALKLDEGTGRWQQGGWEKTEV